MPPSTRLINVLAVGACRAGAHAARTWTNCTVIRCSSPATLQLPSDWVNYTRSSRSATARRSSRGPTRTRAEPGRASTSGRATMRDRVTQAVYAFMEDHPTVVSLVFVVFLYVVLALVALVFETYEKRKKAAKRAREEEEKTSAESDKNK